MTDWESPQGFTPEEAVLVASEHAQSKDVHDAKTVTFDGNTHVHLDLHNGDIVVINPDPQDCFHIDSYWPRSIEPL
jgi:hypothetical protein